MKVLNVDLWKSYLHYVKETKGSLPSFRYKLCKLFVILKGLSEIVTGLTYRAIM
jgi:hypothetical protein